MPAAPPSLGMAGEESEDLPQAGLERACSCESECKDTELNESECKDTELNEIE